MSPREEPVVSPGETPLVSPREQPVGHARDALGRRVPPGSPEQVSEISEVALPPGQALVAARALLAAGRAFGAHEIFEAVWKACPATERDLWQGLAQVCVGLTHLQRGNAVGAQTLLRRGAGHLRESGPLGETAWPAGEPSDGEPGDGEPTDGDPFAVDPVAVADRATALADRVTAGAGFTPADLTIV